MISLGAKIRLFRKKYRLTQEQLGELCGASRQSISRYETESSRPDFEVVQKMAVIFNTDINYLMSYKQQEIGDAEIYLNGYEVELIEQYRKSSKRIQVSMRKLIKELSIVGNHTPYEDATQAVLSICEDE